MAKFYYGITRGGNGYSSATVSTATTGKEIEVVVDNATLTDKATVVALMEVLQEFVTTSNWPPA